MILLLCAGIYLILWGRKNQPPVPVRPPPLPPPPWGPGPVTLVPAEPAYSAELDPGWLGYAYTADLWAGVIRPLPYDDPAQPATLWNGVSTLWGRR